MQRHRYIMGVSPIIVFDTTYGSAYSGIDTMAEAMIQVIGGEWSYKFASEAQWRTSKQWRHW